MFFVKNLDTMGKKRKIKDLKKHGKINEVQKDEMKRILGGREKLSKFRRIIIGFTDIMPQ